MTITRRPEKKKKLIRDTTTSRYLLRVYCLYGLARNSPRDRVSNFEKVYTLWSVLARLQYIHTHTHATWVTAHVRITGITRKKKNICIRLIIFFPFYYLPVVARHIFIFSLFAGFYIIFRRTFLDDAVVSLNVSAIVARDDGRGKLIGTTAVR